MNDNKWRNEYKYIVNATQLAMLSYRFGVMMQKDIHTTSVKGGGRAYNVRSVYFDDHNNTSFLDNEDGPDLREKFRIRIYNHSDERITLELKSRRAQKCLKRSCSLTREQCDLLIQGENVPINNEQPFLLRKLITQIHTRGMRPVVIVEYDRVPYFHPLGNVRVTLDCNLRASNQCNQFLNPKVPLRPILSRGVHVVEVKWDDFLPGFVRQAIMLGCLHKTKFSKFYLCRKYSAEEKTFNA